MARIVAWHGLAESDVISVAVCGSRKARAGGRVFRKSYFRPLPNLRFGVGDVVLLLRYFTFSSPTRQLSRHGVGMGAMRL